MSPKSKQGFKLKSFFGFGSSRSKGEGRRKVEQQQIRGPAGVLPQVSRPSGAVTILPSPAAHPIADVLAVKSDPAAPQSDSGSLIGSTASSSTTTSPAVPSPSPFPHPITFKRPDGSPSFLANANNFQLQSLNYFQNVQGSIALGEPVSSSSGAAAGSR